VSVDKLYVSKSLPLFVILCLLVLSFLGLSFGVFAETVDYEIVSSESDARLAIANAEERIVVCYKAVAAADDAGANVTALLGVLNEAGELLSRAKLAYKVGDFDSAVSFALLSQEKVNDFVDEANALREATLRERYWDFMVNFVGSLVGAVAVVVGGFVVWRLMKRREEAKGRI